MKKLILALSVFILAGAFLAFFLLKKDSGPVTFTTFPAAHGFLSPYQEKEEISFEIFFDRKSMFVEERTLNAAWIADENGENVLALNPVEIRKTENSFVHNGKTYQGYLFLFAGPKTDDGFLFELKDAHLFLEYKSGKEIKVPVGSFALEKIPAFGSEELYVSRLQGIVNELEGVKTLVGICLSLKNKTSEKIVIKAVEPVSSTVRGDAAGMMELGDEEIGPGTDIRELLPDYDPQLIATRKTELEIPPNGETRILLPLKYLQKLPTNTLAFRIEYECLGETQTCYFNEFTFFTGGRTVKDAINSLLFQTNEDD